MTEMALQIALVGNPNCGKTALFNQLTGARQKVANYAGVTVERKEGRFATPSGRAIKVLDLPGAYSFESASPDERITQQVLTGNYPGEATPDLIVCVVDATNLRLHLRFVLELRQLERPMVLALNMMDSAQRRGIQIDITTLEKELGIPVVETIAVQRGGTIALTTWLDNYKADSSTPSSTLYTDHHAEVRRLLQQAVSTTHVSDNINDAIDRWVLHRILGPIILAIIMFMVFQAVYSLGKPLTDMIGDTFGTLGTLVGAWLPEGPLRGLVSDGILSGLGSVLGFLPEILVLFFFIMILEESGYLPRAAFLLDRVMVSVGLTGRSFIPMLSSFACAIPGIIGTRSITDRRDRLVTILVAPLMTCSARLPVYALLISAFIPSRAILGLFNLQGLVLFALYMLGIGGAMLVGWVCKRLNKDRSEHPLIMELPSYRLPRIRDLIIGLYERGAIFLRKLTGVILALTVIMWFISTFPSAPAGATGPAIDYSIAGYLGRAMQYLFIPMGFNWQITLSLIPAFAARETAVATLATVYAVANASDENTTALAHALSNHFALPSALALMVWFAFAPQCMSTLAVIRRETGSWKQVVLSFGYMFVVAYIAATLTYQLARLWL